MNGRRCSLALLTLCLLGAGALAQTAPADQPLGNVPPDTKLVPKGTSALFAPEKSSGSGNQLAFYFVGMLALVAGGIYLLKRGVPIRGLRTGENHLHLLETKVLGNRQFLVVVKYEDNKMLLGVGPGQIQYLCPLDSADEDMDRLMRKSGQMSGPEQP